MWEGGRNGGREEEKRDKEEKKASKRESVLSNACSVAQRKCLKINSFVTVYLYIFEYT